MSRLKREFKKYRDTLVITEHNTIERLIAISEDSMDKCYITINDNGETSLYPIYMFMIFLKSCKNKRAYRHYDYMFNQRCKEEKQWVD